VYDSTGACLEPGSVKIGQSGLKPGRAVEKNQRAPDIPDHFEALDSSFFSLGQDENYYETLNSLANDLRDEILSSLRDCAFDLRIFESVKDEEVMGESLLRSVHSSTVKGRLSRLAHGDAVLTKFEFKYPFPRVSKTIDPPVLDFKVIPESEPPTNIHVLIGRNGVGKTRCMMEILKTLLSGGGSQNDNIPPATDLGIDPDEWNFSRVVSISFSAFDNFELLDASSLRIPYTQIGLKYNDDNASGEFEVQIKTPSKLADEFCKSLQLCTNRPRKERWLGALATLENDPLFAEANVASLLNIENAERLKEQAKSMFLRLSSGHSVILLTITRLVELVDEKTLVLFDEPEGYLHPPLLSAFIRSLSDLLVKRNGVAIISTHSPVVIQEIPSSCVWKLSRAGLLSTAERPTIETFGENVAILTREIFGLEVTNAGFYNLIKSAIEKEDLSYEGVLRHFGEQLGAEAKAMAKCISTIRGLERDA
jgi:ABC-type transport system involved in cytochrome c biogenesis ATPase subunit